MAFQPNYRQERASRERVKNSRKAEKIRKREEASSERKAAREISTDETDQK